MSKKKFLLIFAVILCIGVIAGAISYGTSQGSIGHLAGQYLQQMTSQNHPGEQSSVAATYKDHTITIATVRYQQNMNILRTEEEASRWDTDREAIDQIIEDIILLEEAERLGLSATKEEIAAMVQSSRDSYELPAGKAFLDDYCAGANITIEEYFMLLEEQAPSVIARQKLKDAVGKEYCETHGLEFTKINPPAEMLDAVNNYINTLFESQREHIVYYVGHDLQ